MTAFTEIILADFPIAEDDAADICVTFVRRCGCDDVHSIDFARRGALEMTGAERALVLAWIDANGHEIDDMIAAKRDAEREAA